MPINDTKLQLDAAIAAGDGFVLAASDPMPLDTPIPGVVDALAVAGVSLTAAGGTVDAVIIGAPGDDDKLPDAGRVFVVLSEVPGASSGFGGTAPQIILDGVDAGDAAGAAVAAIDDLNGGGVAEFLVGAPGADVGAASDAGRTYVVWGKTTAGGIDLADATAGNGKGFSITGEASGDHSGAALAAIASGNADTKQEILIGAAGNDAGGIDAGAAYVVFGKSSSADVSLSTIAAGTGGGYKIVGENAGDAAGTSVAAIGDQNGDGKGDLLVGAIGNDAGGTDAGAVYVVFNKATSTAVNLDNIALGVGGYKIVGNAGDGIGSVVSSIGDVNGDGLSDILIGTQAADTAYVVFGKGDGTTVNLADVAAGAGGFAIVGENAGDLVGISVAGGVDLNGDGVSDFLIGAKHNAENGSDAGAVYAVWGGGTGTVDLSMIAQSMGGSKIVGTAGSLTGSDVAILGDVNNDGVRDLAIGAAGSESVTTLFTPTTLWVPDTNVYGTNGDDIIDAGFGGTHKVGEGADNVVAAGGNDWVSTHDGDDTLDGGAGADTLIGGAGNDTYYVDDAGDLAIEAAGEGSDLVIASVDYALAEGSEIETLQLSGFGLSGVGNSGANTIIGTDGSDSIDGGGGLDTLIGGAGDDTYTVEDAAATIVEAAGGGTDTLITSLDVVLQDNVENLILTGAAGRTGTGNAAANSIVGTAFDDTLDGAGGADTLAGGAGDDTYRVDTSLDIVIEQSGGGTDTVFATANYTLSANIENLTLEGAASSGTGNSEDNTIAAGSVAATLNGAGGNDTLIGSDLGDSLLGGSGDDHLVGGKGNDTLDGGSGTNLLDGGEGDDTYIVNSPTDTIVEMAGGGNDTVVVGVDYTLTEGSEVENVTLSGTAHNATGNSGTNTITGNALDNTLDGGAGDDTLIGGAGNDTYLLSGAGDIVVELAGGGKDTVVAGFDATLGEEVENLTLVGAGHVGTGNALDNVLTGTDGADTLRGEAGNDTLKGGLGADIMIGGTGDDTYYIDDAGDVVTEAAGEGFDTVVVSSDWVLADNIEAVRLTGSGHALTGNAAANTLEGDTGDDTLDGGGGDDIELGGDGDDHLISASGHDTLAGGAGDDVYVIKGGSAHIEDFQGHDTVDASEATGDSHIDLSGETASEVENEVVDFGTGGTITSALDVQFLQDLTGSFADDIATVRGLVPQIVSALQAVQVNSEFGVSTFRDKPIGSFGSPGDWVYTTQQVLSANTATLTAAYNAMVASGGNDAPEAQLEALMQLALRATTEVGFQNNAARFVVVFTDADFHVAGDGASAGITTANNGDAIIAGGGIGEDYPMISQVKAALEAANIIPIFAIAGGPTIESSYQGLIVSLGRGTMVPLTANSSNVVAAITAGLTTATTTHIADAVGGVGNDTLIGNVGDNVLTGNDGNDTLIGGIGNDTLKGGTGDDRLDGGAGTDRLEGYTGIDTAVYAGASSDYQITELATGGFEVREIATGVTDTLAGVEYAAFSDTTLALGGGVVPTNLPPVVSGPILVSAIEDGASVVVSALANATDPDSPTLTANVDTAALPAGVTFDAATQSFSIDPTNAAFQSLGEGQTLDIIIAYQISDGIASTAASIQLSLTGTNDAAVLSSAAVTLTEADGVLSTSGDLTVTDVDSPAAFVAQTGTVGSYGSFAIDATGHWTFTANSAFDTLNVGDSMTDSFVVAAVDGTTTSVAVTIAGTNDAAVLSSAAVTLAETDAALTTSGDLTVTDVDSPAAFVAQTGTVGAYGSFAIDASGHWTFTANSAFDALNVGDGITDSFVVAAVDGTTTSVAVTITGTAETPILTIGGDLAGETIEDERTVFTGQATATDQFGGASTFVASVSPSAGLFGALVINATGNWTYTLDNSNPLVQQLERGDVLVDHIQVVAADGTAATIDVTINGIEEAPVGSSSPIYGTSAGETINGTGGADVIYGLDGNDTIYGGDGNDIINGGFGRDLVDAGAGDDLIVVGGGTNGPLRLSSDPVDGGVGYDTVLLEGAQGNYHITQILGANPIINATDLRTGQTATFANIEMLSFTDGTSIELVPRNQAPIVSGPLQLDANEDGAAVSVDALASAFDPNGDSMSAIVDSTSLPAGISYDATTQAFWLDPAAATFQSLGLGETATFSVAYQVSDGSLTTPATLEVTVTGTNDGPIVAGRILSLATEGGPIVAANALSQASDADLHDVLQVVDVPATLPAGVTYDAATSRFLLDPTNPAYASLNAGQSLDVVIAYGITDGTITTSAEVVFTVTGVTQSAGVTLVGTSRADTLTGGSGDDTLDGKAGADSLIGMAGNDTYMVDNAGDRVIESVGEGADTVLSSVSIALAANVENLTLTTYKAVIGTGNELDNILVGSTASNTLIGASGNDQLFGGGNSDRLLGGDGNDLLDGGSDSDTMLGGLGDDTYMVDTSGDVVDEQGGDGHDLVLSAVNFNLSDPNHTLGLVEDLMLTGSQAIRATGNGLDNVITGNDIGNTLSGLGGADTLDGGLGVDTATYAKSALGVEVSLETGLGHGGDAEGDHLLSIENLIGSGQNDTLEGDSGDNVLVGGANVSGGDTVSYAHASGAVTVNLLVTAAQNTLGAGVDTLSGFENVTGSDYGDTLVGGKSGSVISGLAGSDTLTGGVGADTIIGGLGDDLLTGGKGVDHFVFNNADEGLDTITDFKSGTDWLQISADGFGGGLVAGAGASLIAVADISLASSASGDGYFIFDNAGSDGGTVYWDATGGTSDDATAIARVNGLSVTALDFHIV